jgi:hypothetical protein
MSSKLDQLVGRLRRRLLARRELAPEDVNALASACGRWLGLECVRPGLYRSRQVPGLVIAHRSNPFASSTGWTISHSSWPLPVEAGPTMKHALAHLAVALDIGVDEGSTSAARP